MSEGVEDQILQAQSELEPDELQLSKFEELKIKYTREFLLELSEAEACWSSKLPRDFDLEILREISDASDDKVEQRTDERTSVNSSIYVVSPSLRWDLGSPGERWTSSPMITSKESKLNLNLHSGQWLIIYHGWKTEIKLGTVVYPEILAIINLGFWVRKLKKAIHFILERAKTLIVLRIFIRSGHCSGNSVVTSLRSTNKKIARLFSCYLKYPLKPDTHRIKTLFSLSQFESDSPASKPSWRKKPQLEQHIISGAKIPENVACITPKIEVKGSDVDRVFRDVTNTFSKTSLKDNHFDSVLQIHSGGGCTETKKILQPLDASPELTTATDHKDPADNVAFEDHEIKFDDVWAKISENLQEESVFKDLPDSEIETHLPKDDALDSEDEIYLPDEDKLITIDDLIAPYRALNIKKAEPLLRQNSHDVISPKSTYFYPWSDFVPDYIPTLNHYTSSNFHQSPFHETATLTKPKANNSLVHYSVLQQPNICTQPQNRTVIDAACTTGPVRKPATHNLAARFLPWTSPQTIYQLFGNSDGGIFGNSKCTRRTQC